MKRIEFEKLVEQAALNLPKYIQNKMNNVEIVVEDKPSKEQLKKIKISSEYSLLGLYEGVPQNAWGRGFGNILPDKITIFKKAIESYTKSKKELVELIKNTVWHEIAHHFGFDEKDIKSLEQKKR
ncbi:MAG: metallopeptidase family protein [Parcubacteria group bacterium]|nr:metallopeptidase family protein [Parcubacteria group bacterium]